MTNTDSCDHPVGRCRDCAMDAKAADVARELEKCLDRTVSDPGTDSEWHEGELKPLEPLIVRLWDEWKRTYDGSHPASGLVRYDLKLAIFTACRFYSAEMRSCEAIYQIKPLINAKSGGILELRLYINGSRVQADDRWRNPPNADTEHWSVSRYYGIVGNVVRELRNQSVGESQYSIKLRKLLDEETRLHDQLAIDSERSAESHHCIENALKRVCLQIETLKAEHAGTVVRQSDGPYEMVVSTDTLAPTFVPARNGIRQSPVRTLPFIPDTEYVVAANGVQVPVTWVLRNHPKTEMSKLYAWFAGDSVELRFNGQNLIAEPTTLDVLGAARALLDMSGKHSNTVPVVSDEKAHQTSSSVSIAVKKLRDMELRQVFLAIAPKVVWPIAWTVMSAYVVVTSLVAQLMGHASYSAVPQLACLIFVSTLAAGNISRRHQGSRRGLPAFSVLFSVGLLTATVLSGQVWLLIPELFLCGLLFVGARRVAKSRPRYRVIPSSAGLSVSDNVR